MRLSRSKNSGQTILELCFFVIWFAGFFATALYLFAVFDVSQKQTMLVRTQAFIELGNYSDYGQTEHGEDNPEEEASQVIFRLGEKSRGVRVDLQDLESFQEAVQGDLELDVMRPKSEDEFWLTFRFPKARTFLGYRDPRTNEALLRLPLEQTLYIAHNRNFSPSDEVDVDVNETGLFSGGMELMAFSRASQIPIHIEEAMKDNLDDFRNALKGLVKNDQSLSEEAAKLEDNANASEGITGGAVASLISMAIQMAMSAGLDALSNAFADAGAAISEGGAQAAGEGANAAAGGSLGGYLDSIFAPFTDPLQGVQAFANKDLLAGPLTALTAPFQLPVMGVKGITGGIAQGGFSGIATTMQGLGYVGQSAQMVGGFAGADMSGLSAAVSILHAPSALTSGLTNFESALASEHNTFGVSNMMGAIQALPEVITPVASLVSTFAPEVAAPLSMVNAAVGAVGMVGGLAGDVSGITSGSLDTLGEIGEFTSGVGSVLTTAGALTGQEVEAGAYLMVAGGGLMGLEAVGDFAADFKLSEIGKGDFSLNPVDVGKHLLKGNIDNAKGVLTDFAKDMKDMNKDIRSNVSDIFAKQVTLPEGAQAGDLMSQVASLDRSTDGGFRYFADGIRADVGKANLDRAGMRLNEMQNAVLKNMQFRGASSAEIAAVQTQFHDIRSSIDHLSAFKAEKAAYDSEIVSVGNAAAQNLSATLSNYLNENDLARAQIRGIRVGNSVASMTNEALSAGMTYEQVKAMEREHSGKHPFKSGFGRLTGAELTLDTMRDQEKAATELRFTSQAHQVARELRAKEAERLSSLDRAKKITHIAQGILSTGPITAEDPSALKAIAAQASGLLEAAQRESGLDDKFRQRMQVQIDKLNRIADGSRDSDFISSKETLRLISREVAERELQFQITRRRLLMAKDQLDESTQCAGTAC